LNRSVVEMICLQHRNISVLQEKDDNKKEKDILRDLGMGLRKKTVVKFTATATKATQLTNMLRPYRITGNFACIYLVA
jgi:hypothetical protein